MPDCKHAKTAIQRVLKSCAECEVDVIHQDVKPIRVPEPISEARLAEIEEVLTYNAKQKYHEDVTELDDVVGELIVEVRRLRLIEHAARGVCAADDTSWTERDHREFLDDLRAVLNKP